MLLAAHYFGVRVGKIETYVWAQSMHQVSLITEEE